jgi:hypothetical protein
MFPTAIPDQVLGTGDTRELGMRYFTTVYLEPSG